MKARVYGVVFIFILLSNTWSLAAPSMQFNSTQFDFGQIYQGDKVLHTFEFTNAGQDPLVIDRVRSSCGCTAVLVSEKNVPPGEKGEIQANFDSARFRGPVSKTVYLYSNDPIYPVMQLTIKGQVLEIVAIEPSQVNFGTVPGEQSLTSRVILKNQGQQKLTFGTISTTAKELEAELSKTALDVNEEMTLDLLLTPKPGTVRFSGYILIPVKGVPKDQLRIPVYASVKQ